MQCARALRAKVLNEGKDVGVGREGPDKLRHRVRSCRRYDIAFAFFLLATECIVTLTYGTCFRYLAQFTCLPKLKPRFGFGNGRASILCTPANPNPFARTFANAAARTMGANAPWGSFAYGRYPIFRFTKMTRL
jgi:hypothetical protein